MSCPCFDAPETSNDKRERIKVLAIELGDLLSVNAAAHGLCPHAVAVWINNSLDSIHEQFGPVIRGELVKLLQGPPTPKSKTMH